MQLDQRKLHILEAIIDDYILTATPVGSRTLSKRGDFQLSSATIRNEMSDLEEMGYLEQPHTSAGRIPSDKAYRLYVDNIMRRAQLSEDEVHLLKSYLSNRVRDVEMVIKQTARALSEVTRYTAMVLPPQLHAVRLRHIQLVPVGEGRAVLVIVTDTGMTKDSIVRVPDNMGRRELEQLSHQLTERFYNMRLKDLNSVGLTGFLHDLGSQGAFLQELISAVQVSLEPDIHKVELSGATNMLAFPEYSDMEKAKNFLSIIEGKDALYALLTKEPSVEFSIRIGGENDSANLQDYSVVTATYKLGNEPVGSFGVIGPTRMNYSKVLSVLEFMRLSLSQIFTNLIEEDKS